jgi:hypothetical protein
MSKSTATIKRHLNQQRMNARSTKIKEDEHYDNESATPLDNSVKKISNMRQQSMLDKYILIKLDASL